MVEGTAKVTIDENVQFVSEDQSVHRMEDSGKVDIVIIVIQTGIYLGVDDIVRYEDKYSRGQGAKS